MQIYKMLLLMIMFLISFSSQTALAAEGCPDGMTEVLYMKTGENVCTLNRDAGTESVDKFSEDASNETFSMSDNEYLSLISESVRNGGWGFMLGLGFGLNDDIFEDTAAVDIKARTGIQFASSNAASFGLYLDFNMRPGNNPVFTMDVTLDPTLHISFRRTRISLALGFGAFMNKSTTDFFDNHTISKIYYNAFFEFKPAFLVDWFLTQNAFWGLNVDFPVLLLHDKNVKVVIDMNAHIGYRF